jgi:rfaE bifunctional protein nucleotidyltransferase chain/domain
MERSSKILTQSEAATVAQNWRAQGLRVVLTNGCFDLIHPGHVTYLMAARELGDRLVVGVNDDGSTARLKGSGRPILRASDRALILSALCFVDAVVVFGQDTAEELVRAIRPDVYAKGGDYSDVGPKAPPEAAAARQVGAQFVILPYVSGYSTSDIIKTIVSRYCQG